jgi:hypothetical protein
VQAEGQMDEPRGLLGQQAAQFPCARGGGFPPVQLQQNHDAQFQPRRRSGALRRKAIELAKRFTGHPQFIVALRSRQRFLVLNGKRHLHHI